ncbi:MAG: helix-hairpin-helix domain-containing protein [Pseudomonadota bacterium]
MVMVLVLVGSIGLTFAQVEANKADQAALESVKGIGPSTSTKILDARKKGGPFKSWPDLAERVKGIGDKTAVKLSDAGLTVNGQSLANAGVVPAFASKTKDTNVENRTRPGFGSTPSSGSSAMSGAASNVASKPATSARASTAPPPSPPLFPSSPSPSPSNRPPTSVQTK